MHLCSINCIHYCIFPNQAEHWKDDVDSFHVNYMAQCSLSC